MSTGQVLVVDDLVDVRTALSRLIKALDYTVFEAKDAKEALEYIEKYEIEVAIIDHCLHPGEPDAGMNGTQLMKKIRERWPHIALLLLTAYKPEVETTVEVMYSGATFLTRLTKPVASGELEEKLKEGIRFFLKKEREAASKAISKTVVEESYPEDFDYYLEVGNLTFAPEGRQVWMDGKGAISLTNTEYDVLLFLSERSETLVTPDALSVGLGRSTEKNLASNFIRTWITRLRNRLAEYKPEHDYFENVRGLGYKMIPLYKDSDH